MPHKIDIIIPCFNYAHFLDDCLMAVTGQTRGDFAVLLMDNASTDNTAQVAERWMARDPRIRYHRNENNIGAVGNMQRGYELTSAEYVVILPADDLWEPEFLASTCDALDQHERCAYAYTGWGSCQHPDDPMGKMTTVPHMQEGPVEDMAFLTMQNYIPLSFGVFRRSLCDKVGGVYPRFLPMLGDLFLWMRLSTQGSGYFVNRQLGRLRFHGSNTSHELHATGRSAFDLIHILDLVFESDMWSKPARLLAKARQIQLLTGQPLCNIVLSMGTDKTLPIVKSFVDTDRYAFGLMAALAVRRYPEVAGLTDTFSDTENLLRELALGDIPADADTALYNDISAMSPTANQSAQDQRYQTWLGKRAFLDGDISIINEGILGFRGTTLIQVVIRLTDGAGPLLADTLESLNNQFYGNWRIDVVATADHPVPQGLPDNFGWHPMARLEEAKPGLDLLLAATAGDLIIEVPAGTRFDPLCFWRIAVEAHKHPNAAAFFCDDDRVDTAGQNKRSNVRFKTPIDIEQVRSQDAVGPLFIKRHVLKQAGGIAASAEIPWYENLLDLLLQVETAAIVHIPDVLFSLPDLPSADAAAYISLLQAHLDKTGMDADIQPSSPRTWQVIYHLNRLPLVSIILPASSKLEFLQPCITDIATRTSYPHLELILVADGHELDFEAGDWLKSISSGNPNVRLILAPPEASTSERINMAAREAVGEFLLLASEEIRILQDDWLEQLLRHGMREGIAAVTPRLVSPQTGSLGHVGYILGLAGVACSPYAGVASFKERGWNDYLNVSRTIEAVPLHCLLIKAAAFREIGQLDAASFPKTLADIDMSLKLRGLGESLIYTPGVTVAHYGAKPVEDSFSSAESVAGRLLQENASLNALYERHRKMLSQPGLTSPNLSLSSQDLQPETELVPPWRYLPSSKPKILTRPLTNGQGIYRISMPLAAARQAGLVLGCEVYQESSRVLNPIELARVGADSLVVQHFISDNRISEIHNLRRFKPDAFIVYACDDLMTDMPIKSFFRPRIPIDARSRLKLALRDCDRLVVSTDFLADTCRHFISDIRVVPNRIERKTWCHLQSRKRTGRKPRVGWAGGAGHRGDLELLRPVVEATHQEVDWIFFGMCPEAMRPYIREFHAGGRFDVYPARLAALDLDLAVAPLEVHPFNQAKSNLRLIEYGVLSLPVVCTDIDPYRNSPAKLVQNEPDQWINAIRERIYDLDAAEAEGAAMQRWVMDNFILDDHVSEWVFAHLPGN